MQAHQYSIGDFCAMTMGLSPTAVGCFTMLVNRYLFTEQPVSNAWINAVFSKRDLKHVEQVLDLFFTETEEGWIFARLTDKVEKEARASNASRENGKKGGRPRKGAVVETFGETQSVKTENLEKPNHNLDGENQNLDETQTKPNQNLEGDLGFHQVSSSLYISSSLPSFSNEGNPKDKEEKKEIFKEKNEESETSLGRENQASLALATSQGANHGAEGGAGEGAPKATKGARAKPKKGCPFVADQKIPDELKNIFDAKCAEQNVTLSNSAQTVFSQFVNYHLAKGSVFADWVAAWRTWTMRAIQYAKQDNKNKAKNRPVASSNAYDYDVAF